MKRLIALTLSILLFINVVQALTLVENTSCGPYNVEAYTDGEKTIVLFLFNPDFYNFTYRNAYVGIEIKFDRKILKCRRDIENKYGLSYSVGAPEIRTENILNVPAEVLLEIYLKAYPKEIDKNALINEVLTNRPQQKILLVVNPAEAVNINTTYYSRELIKLFFGEKFWEENIKEPHDLAPLIGAIGHEHIIYGYVPVTINHEEAKKKAQAEGKSLEEVIKEVIDVVRTVIPENVTIVIAVEKPVTATPLVGLPEEKNNQETPLETDKGTENSEQNTAIYLLPIIALIAFILLMKKQ